MGRALSNRLGRCDRVHDRGNDVPSCCRHRISSALKDLHETSQGSKPAWARQNEQGFCDFSCVVAGGAGRGFAPERWLSVPPKRLSRYNAECHRYSQSLAIANAQIFISSHRTNYLSSNLRHSRFRSSSGSRPLRGLWGWPSSRPTWSEGQYQPLQAWILGPSAALLHLSMARGPRHRVIGAIQSYPPKTILIPALLSEVATSSNGEKSQCLSGPVPVRRIFHRLLHKR